MAHALEEAENEREQKDKSFQENAALGVEIYALRRSLQVRSRGGAADVNKERAQVDGSQTGV